jgi:hypothetical protein
VRVKAVTAADHGERTHGRQVVGPGRHQRTAEDRAVRVLAETILVNTLTSLPAFFVDVPAWLKLASASRSC